MRTDRVFYASLVTLAAPIVFQNLITSSLNAIDVMMIGQLGEISVAAVGLADQVSFLFILLLFGITSGAAVYTAQLWGKGDLVNIRRVLGVGLSFSLTGGVFFALAASLFPTQIMGIYTADPDVIALGSNYLRIVWFSYPLMAITFMFSSVLRSTRQVRYPVIASVVGLSLKTLLNLGLIFGNFGLPRLGVSGAALATCIARVIELTILLTLTYTRHLPAAAKPSEMVGFPRSAWKAYLTTTVPVAINEMLWALGITTYNAIYAHIGTQAIAAVNIASTIERLAFTVFMGVSDACGILIGNSIGHGEEEKASRYSRRTLAIATVLGLLIGLVILTVAQPMLGLYNISPEARADAQNILRVMGCALWVRVSNMVLIVGIMRSGGDTRFGFALDAGTMWVVGVPSALIGAFVFHLPVYYVFMLVMSEEFVKYLIGLWRLRSGKWIHNVARTVAS